MRSYAGQLAEAIGRTVARLPVSPGFTPTHMIVIDNERYLSELDVRLSAEGKRRDPADPMSPDIDGIVRQVLVGFTLIGRIGWTFGGIHYFKKKVDGAARHISSAYADRPTVAMPWAMRAALSSPRKRRIRRERLRTLVLLLDRYYRSGIWWVDRLSVALGYLWSSLTTIHAELAFIGFTMALEALVSTSQNEITHILAERCAVVLRKDAAGRVATYCLIKELYGVRSKIVHGRAAPKRGTLTQASLFVYAKRSNIPTSQLSQLADLTLNMVAAVLRMPPLRDILQKQQSEGKTDAEIGSFFAHVLLAGQIPKVAKRTHRGGLCVVV